MDSPTLSIVVPMHDESAVIEAFHDRLTTVLDATGLTFEVVCVNDGSRDDTLLRLEWLHAHDSRFKVIDLSRNFGKEAALTAGIDHASGEAVIPFDADLQDPPEVILELVSRWREGFDVVYATRLEREGESYLKRWTAAAFYRVMQRLTPVPIPADTGDFRLMSRPVVEALREMRERHRFMKGLFSWVGFRQTSVPYRRDPRVAGTTKFNYWKLWNLAVEGITSFSFIPLQLASFLGFLVAVCAIGYGLFMLVRTLVSGNAVPGYPSLMVTVLFLGGVQLMTLGIIGEYVGRIYNESKHRPIYLVRRRWGIGTPGNSSEAVGRAGGPA
ncbi:MAG: glycosyltransferase family 2 protein [bacterium]|nr:glycosyltransferase family 2 protein [bacterium]